MRAADRGEEARARQGARPDRRPFGGCARGRPGRKAKPLCAAAGSGAPNQAERRPGNQAEARPALDRAPVGGRPRPDTRKMGLALFERRSRQLGFVSLAPPPLWGGGGGGGGTLPALSLWRIPLTRIARKCAQSDLSPQAGRGKG